MAVIVVLIEDADLTVGLGLHDVATIDAALGAVGRLPADGPREMLGIVPTRRARTGEQLRNALGVEIFLYSHVGRGADAVEDQQHIFLLDQLACLLDRLRRIEAGVPG